MEYADLAAIQNDLKQGHLQLSALVEGYLTRIQQHLDLNAFIEVFASDARERAETINGKISRGTAGKLAGLVIGLKDNICYAGHKVSAGSKMLSEYTSVYSATVVERLLAEDAIIIGRLNCDEFGMGSANENSIYGPVKNFADKARVSGGSSGGSAVAVQANLCHAALGTDTGGSVRQPAAFCQVIGFKPSYGRISRYGVVAYASSFDQVGTITRSVEDAALLLEVLAGADGYDSTLAQLPAFDSSDQAETSEKKKIAILGGILNSAAIDPQVKGAFETALVSLKASGHEIEEVEFEYLDYLVPAYYILTMAEASSNLSRYDGVHYGYRSNRADSLENTYKFSRAEGFGAEAKRRILMGTFVLSAGYYDAYYAKAQKVRRLICERVEEIFHNHDFILLPTSPELPFPIGQQDTDPVVKYLGDIYTVLASLAGLPAISLPLEASEEGLPIGIQVVGRRFGESDLLSFSKKLKF